MANMPLVWDCHTINSNISAILKEPTVAPYNILIILLFSFVAVQAIEFFISAIDALVVSRTTVSLCPFNHSLSSHLSWGVFSPRSDSYPITCQVPLPFYHTYICANSLKFLHGRNNCQVSFDNTLHAVSYDKLPQYSKNNQCDWFIL